MNKKRTPTKKTKKTIPEAVICKPFQVTLEEVKGDKSRLIKKFIKKVRKAEILKPYYDRLMYFTPKPQRRRQKLKKAIWEERKRRQKDEIV